MISNIRAQLEEFENTETQDFKRKVQQKQQELDTAVAKIRRINQQMQETKIEMNLIKDQYLQLSRRKMNWKPLHLY